MELPGSWALDSSPIGMLSLWVIQSSLRASNTSHMTTTPRFTHPAGTLTLRLTANTYPASHLDAVAESNQKGRTTMSDRKLAGGGFIAGIRNSAVVELLKGL